MLNTECCLVRGGRGGGRLLPVVESAKCWPAAVVSLVSSGFVLLCKNSVFPLRAVIFPPRRPHDQVERNRLNLQ